MTSLAAAFFTAADAFDPKPIAHFNEPTATPHLQSQVDYGADRSKGIEGTPMGALSRDSS
jgi:hypothetical protein